MLLNKIGPDLMMAFYSKGGQTVETLFGLHAFFIRMQNKYDSLEPDQYIENFGSNYTFHCASRTLRRLDMSVVESKNQQRKRNNFIPCDKMWRYYRVVRQQIRDGKFKVEEKLDLMLAQSAMKDGLLQQGRKNK